MDSVFNLSEKTILITGASSGIGRSIAQVCANYGAKLILNGRDEGRLQETMDGLDSTGHRYVKADISNDIGLKMLVDNIESLNGFVHCAGVNTKTPVKFLTESKLDDLMRPNCYAPALIIQSLLKQKKIKKQASLVMISSIASTYATISNAAYAASKGALNSLTRVMALELAPQRIRVNSIQPGMVNTAILGSYDLQEELKDFENQYPLGRFGKPEDVAYAAVYLLSNASEWVTGTSLIIDGGITLR